MNLIYKHKKFSAFFLIWVVIHFIFFTIGQFDFTVDDYFWPFTTDFGLRQYDFLEFFIYVALPLLIFALVRLLKSDS